MKALSYWKIVVRDGSDFLSRFLSLLDELEIRHCVIGGQGVNAYAEPVVSLDLDVVVAVEDLDRLEPVLQEQFQVQRFEHSINLSSPDSDLRVQIQRDSRYASFIDRSTPRLVLGLTLPVAAPEDVLQGKIWAVQDPARRASKRQKDLADIARLLEFDPSLRRFVPEEVLALLL